MLLGRSAECRALEQTLERVRGGDSAVLVVRGEAGVGKTALLHYCSRQASDFRVARVAGVESEMELAYAGLHQLCAPMLNRLETLPHPQQNALRVALGLHSGEATDRFLVALATLGLLSEAASDRPLLCLVDDAQWLDSASAQVLGFVARRLQADSVALLFAIREPSGDRELATLPDLRVEGLSEEHARELLGTVIPGRLDVRARDRLVAETRGNPLALLELPHRLTATQLPGGFGLLGPQELTGRIEQSFLDRLESLPKEARLLLLVAAAEPTDDPLLVWRAAERLGVPPSAAAATDAEGLLAIDASVRFRHPLVRSAIYRSAQAHERRAVHVALGEATDPHVDPDRRAWHLAAAAPGPDEQVAVELERSASRAQARGGLAAAAAFLRRVVALTRDPARRAERALAAATTSLHAGEFDAAHSLISAAELGRLDDFQRARVDLLRGQIVAAAGLGSEAPAQLLRAAKKLEPLDIELAREAYLDAWAAALLAGNLARGGNMLDVSEAARSAPPPPGPPAASDLLLDGMSTLMTEGLETAVTKLRDAVAAFLSQDLSVERGLQWTVLASCAAVELWDFPSWEAIITRQMELGRETGALAPLAIALNGMGIVVAWRGDFTEAARVVAEADAVTEATRTRIAAYGGMLFAALQGREAEARARIEHVIEAAVTGGEGQAVQWAHWTTAVLCNGLGQHEEALEAARSAWADWPDWFVGIWALPELIEAGVKLGLADQAGEALEPLALSVNSTGGDWGLGILARARALLASGEAAETSYREAIERLTRTPLRPEVARTHLLYGEWLHGQQRRDDARDHLRTAHSMFNSIGAEAFAERARQDLAATGVVVRARADQSRTDLTAQEEHIARLAREGRTNVQIGTELYLSSRTVEWHLKKVFAKLGISSRRELRDALPDHS